MDGPPPLRFSQDAAAAAAAQLRALAAALDAGMLPVSQDVPLVQADWAGGARDTFDGAYLQLHARLAEVADELSTAARRVETLAVDAAWEDSRRAGLRAAATRPAPDGPYRPPR